MLVLTRRTQETVILTFPDNKEAIITVLDIHKGRVRLGIKAHSDIIIKREEIYEQQNRT